MPSASDRRMDVDTPTEAPRYPRVVLAAVCIPWDERGDIVEDVFREQVRLHLRAGVKHLYVVGAKNGTSNIVMLHDLLTQAPAIRQFYTELGYPQGCLAGEPGYLMSLTTMNPWLGVKFFEAGVAGDLATLFGIQAESLALFEL